LTISSSAVAEKTTICYYFCDEKAIDTRTSQTGSETSQGRGRGCNLLNLPFGPPLNLRPKARNKTVIQLELLKELLEQFITFTMKETFLQQGDTFRYSLLRSKLRGVWWILQPTNTFAILRVAVALLTPAFRISWKQRIYQTSTTNTTLVSLWTCQ